MSIRRQLVLLDLLVSHNTVTMEQMVDRLWGDDPSGGPLSADRMVAMLLGSLREELETYGVTIEFSRARREYTIPADQRSAADAALDALQEEARRRRKKATDVRHMPAHDRAVV